MSRHSAGRYEITEHGAGELKEPQKLLIPLPGSQIHEKRAAPVGMVGDQSTCHKPYQIIGNDRQFCGMFKQLRLIPADPGHFTAGVNRINPASGLLDYDRIRLL